MTTAGARGRTVGRGPDGGAISLELVILAPALLAVAMVVVASGRLALTDQAVDHAAFEAARTASLARSAAEAVSSADATARANLADSACGAPTAAVDASGFAARPGVPASVTVTVSCTVGLSDLGVPGLPGSRTLSGTATSPVDVYRERS